jgi:hypothetical protein
MPDLPTLTLSQNHFDRVVAAFPGDTLGEKAQAYRAWLVNKLIDYVKNTETQNLDRQIASEAAARRAALYQQIENSLPPRPAFPPEPPPPVPPIGEGSDDPERP